MTPEQVVSIILIVPVALVAYTLCEYGTCRLRLKREKPGPEISFMNRKDLELLRSALVNSSDRNTYARAIDLVEGELAGMDLANRYTKTHQWIRTSSDKGGKGNG